MSISKSDLRKTCRAARAKLTDRADLDAQIRARVLPLLSDKQSVFCYVSMGCEADTHGIIRALFSAGKTVLVPHTEGGVMSLRHLINPDKLTPDRVGNIPDEAAEPYSEGVSIRVGPDKAPGGEENIPPDQSGEPEAAIVPMLGFYGFYRLGYGGGYYDKFLAGRDILKIGLAYDDQQLDADFHEDFDVPLDCIVTPTKIFWAKEN